MNDAPNDAPRERIGFIGLGIMGRSMAMNLVRAGFSVRVWNRTAEKMASLLAAGGDAGKSPADVAEHSDVVITCVSDTPDVSAVLLGESGVIHGARAGTLVVDTSTVSPGATRRIAAELAEKDVHMLDAPISGGSEGAAAGTLSIMVGGDPEQVARATPALEVMGSRITHVGPIGSGQTVKLVNQIVVVGTMLAVGEGLLFAQASGVDLERTLEAITGGAAGSWMLENRGPQVAKRDWSPGFTIDLQQKDLRLALEAAGELGVPLLGTAGISQLYRSLQRAGLGAEGNHALVKALENLAGIEIGKAEGSGGVVTGSRARP